MNQTSPQLTVVVTRASAPTTNSLQNRGSIWVTRLRENISNAILLGECKTLLGRTHCTTKGEPVTATTNLRGWEKGD